MKASILINGILVLETIMLKCENISKTYKSGSWFSKKEEKQVLKNISFHLKEGRSIGFVGRNGAGKSTLMKIILGLESADNGSVIFMGQNIHNLKYSQRKEVYKNMQIVFQDPQSSMNPNMTVFQIICEPVNNYYKYSIDELRNIVKDLLKSVELDTNIIDKNITMLSGGQQQRVAIARALAINPKVIILDEAVSNLDMVIQSQILKLLEDLKEKYNISLLVISHDIRVVFKLCDDIIFLENGEIKGNFSIENGIDMEHDAFKKMLVF